MNKKKVPVIVSDIDGVLKLQNSAIPQAINGLKVIRKPLNEIDSQNFPDDNIKLPFYLLTNRGNITTQSQIIQVNEAFNLNSKEEMLEPKDVILNYAALVDKLKDFKDKLILLVTGQADEQGIRDGTEIIQEAGYTNYITVEEYITITPFCVQQSRRTKEHIQKKSQIVKDRLGLKDDEIGQPLQCHGIFIMANPKQWEEAIQIILDLLSTENGKIANQIPEIGPEKHIPIFCSYGDLLVKSPYLLPRIICGGFVMALKAVYKGIYKRELDINMYGKPEIHHFEFAQEHGKQYVDENHEISQYYMIGDNPHTDIRGANNIGWVSILVRTGVFQGDENDPIYPARYVVDDFTEAIKLIFQLENIQYLWKNI
ncbi:hypothetical protein IMG5_077480 [Ichthyophthirius multifiliis]|uniref:Uncharacterized protein n=1 Tax=Ichthyophthirius multifiliis TaxID=5932 RepID=G0QQD8_ICHMU|nr:hypothetical protein IMG5_077480 [Ichthyophthirius multifiliis]EGR32567.1 hypothetical protein IMG5_077480 [Ichthyophthirius multifiliis]|eukprot:XP_004036553.1 hypothetical protein IMG5_077480 [Ichthyophthirius multifiliis]